MPAPVHGEITCFWKGAAMGFSIAAPVGPIGVLCIQRTLADGWRMGLASGLGAATADGAYGFVAGFGLTAVSSFLAGEKFWLGLVGGLFLCYLGGRTFLSQPAEQRGATTRKGLADAYLSTVGLTLANPMTILSFVAIFAGFGLGASPDYGAAGALVLGVFSGSACWWLVLASGVEMFRTRLSAALARCVNQISGGVIFAFGFLALLRLRMK